MAGGRLDRLEALASVVAPPFGEIEPAVLEAIDAADALDGDTDLELEFDEPDYREAPKCPAFL